MPDAHVPLADAPFPVGAKKILLPISKIIHKYNLILPQTTANYKKLEMSYNTFFSNFHGRPIKFVIFGLLGLVALYFDILIGLETLFPLSDFLKIHILLVSVIFAIIDTGVSIIASGILASNPISKAWMKKIGRLILELLGIIKLSLLFVYMTSFTEIDTPAIVVNSLFIVLIYTIFHISGSGLLYLLGNFFFKSLLFVSTNPIDIQKKINKNCMKFTITCNQLQVNSATARAFFNIDNICKINK